MDADPCNWHWPQARCRTNFRGWGTLLALPRYWINMSLDCTLGRKLGRQGIGKSAVCPPLCIPHLQMQNKLFLRRCHHVPPTATVALFLKFLQTAQCTLHLRCSENQAMRLPQQAGGKAGACKVWASHSKSSRMFTPHATSPEIVWTSSIVFS